jgi:hypothetical protein
MSAWEQFVSNESRLKSQFRKFYGRYNDFVVITITTGPYAGWFLLYNVLDCLSQSQRVILFT